MTMLPLLLDGYRPINKRWPVFRLDSEGRNIDTLWFTDQRAAKAAGPKCGFGDVRKVGSVFRRRAVFVALYVDDNTLYLWLDGIRLDLIRGNVLVKRSTDFLLRKRFRVWAEGVLVFECRYSHLDYERFPDEDILWYIARSSASREDRLRTMLLWQDKSTGRDEVSDRYFLEVDQRVRALS